MEQNHSSPFLSDGSVCSIRFSITTNEEIQKYSISDCPISHPSQLSNPFLGLPLEHGRCESCGTSEHGQCEGHFGYIELPIPVYHPSHVSELKDILSLVCLKCLRMKKGKVGIKDGKTKVSVTSCLHCRGLPPISIKEIKKSDGAVGLELRVSGQSAKSKPQDGFWNFLGRFGGFRYGDGVYRPLLPYEAFHILKEIPEETKKRLAAKGYFQQNGLIMQRLPVPPNCLCVPEITDGKSIMSSDISNTLLKKVLNKIDLIKRSRSGSPNFESHEVESNDLQISIAQYMHLRGTPKAPHDPKRRFTIDGSNITEYSTKQWLEKIKTLFISKGSSFSSRSVITGDSYIGIDRIGLPSEIAKRITFEERVTLHNIKRSQELLNEGRCVTYRDGSLTYAIAVTSEEIRKKRREHIGPKDTHLRVGQIINRQIIDGDIVFINRPPSTHKHSLQAFRVFIHDDHTVKINPLVCAPLGADFDGDCVHIFYPQSLAAKAEVIELFSIEKQLLSSHTGSLNLQIAHDSLLSLKLIFNASFLRKPAAQQLALLVSSVLPPPAIIKSDNSGPFWTIIQVIQCALPDLMDFSGDKFWIKDSEFLEVNFSRDVMQSSLTDIITLIYSTKGPNEVVNFFNRLQPLLMEILFMDGYSLSLKDFLVPRKIIEEIRKRIQDYSCIVKQLRSGYNELVDMQLEKDLRSIKLPVEKFILSSALGSLIDCRSESSIVKVAQQLGFLGLQLFDRGKYYSKSLVEDCLDVFSNKYCTGESDIPSEAYGLVKSSFFHGLNPFEELVHSLSTREVIVRSSRGLTEPGTLFKNLMAILRDVVICYDGSVRNVCSNSIIQFEYGSADESDPFGTSVAGEPVGVLAATAISNPAYKAVLDSSKSNNSSWELMKEILLSKVNYANSTPDRRVTLYLNDCCCGRKFCKENASIAILNCLKRVTLKDCASLFFIEYEREIGPEMSGLVGHIHLDEMQLNLLNRSSDEILLKCQEVVLSYRKKRGQVSSFFKRITLSFSETCSTRATNDGNLSHFSCLRFSYSDAGTTPLMESLDKTVNFMVNTICPVLLDTIVKGDPRVEEAKIVWIGPDSTSWVRSPGKIPKGELALEVVIEKDSVHKNGDAWRTVLDSCVPVMHLIDTKRSIPYGIQQIQEFLGISCAFDQTMQRLSASIRMVAKGVLKEHLLLVANSMTCTGKLIGFNIGGYRALFRSLKFQAPFTEATLYTPMKCFERAAEKCQTDLLSSVVSSCSWGKQVSVGSGSPFQILWNKQQMEEENNISMYDLLELVRTTSEEGDVRDSWQPEVDTLEEERGIDEACLSPEHDANLRFDDIPEEMENEKLTPDFSRSWENSNTKNSPSVSDQSNSWENWNSKTKSNAWGSDTQASQPRGTSRTSNSSSNAWESMTRPTQPRDTQCWNEKVASEKLDEREEANDKPAELGGWYSQNAESAESDAWDSWKTQPAEKTKPAVADSWGSWKTQPAEIDAWGSWKSHSAEKTQIAEPDAWGGRRTHCAEKNQTAEPDAWDSLKTQPPEHTWGSQNSEKSIDQQSLDDESKEKMTDRWNRGKSPSQNVWSNNTKRNHQNKDNQSNTSQGNQAWKNHKKVHRNNHTGSGGTMDDRKGWNSNRGQSLPRRRQEPFTEEEKSIRVDVEPIMQRMRQILRESSDGVRLSVDDQNFVLDNVFEYHPDKESKVSGEVDYIMVDKHREFADSRCFYVVSEDGSSSDFSYKKCMENFVKVKFPENAESFIGKFLKRPQSQGQANTEPQGTEQHEQGNTELQTQQNSELQAQQNSEQQETVRHQNNWDQE